MSQNDRAWILGLDDLLWIIDAVEGLHDCDPPMSEAAKMGIIFDMNEVRISPEQLVFDWEEDDE